MRTLAMTAWLAALLAAGCTYQPISAVPGSEELPEQLAFRQLYQTPRAYLYASSQAAAEWMGKYLDRELAEVEDRCGVALEPGLVIVLAPGESLVSAGPLTQPVEPRLPAQPAVDLTEHAHLLGLPPALKDTYSWCCVLPTDDSLKAGIRRYFRDYDRKHPDGYFLDDNPVTSVIYRGLMRPTYGVRYVIYGGKQRKLVLARAAISHSAIGAKERARALEAAESAYRQQYEQARTALERVD